MDELIQAIEARDSILVAIGEKLAEMQQRGSDLARFLDQAYEYRLKKLEGLTMHAADQRVHDKDMTKADAA